MYGFWNTEGDERGCGARSDCGAGPEKGPLSTTEMGRSVLTKEMSWKQTYEDGDGDIDIDLDGRISSAI
jgi:hypothetical protein